MMKEMKRILFFGFALLLLSPFSVFADAGAEVTYPYYKKTERWVHTCTGGNQVCNSDQSKRTEEKMGKSTRFNFLKNFITNVIPAGGLLTLNSANLKSSEKEATLYKSWYAKRYGVTSCGKEHTYTTFWSLPSILSGKIGTSEGKIRSFCTGEKGRDDGTKPTDAAPDIDERPYKGTVTVSDTSSSMTTEHVVKEDSRAMLALTVPEATAVPSLTMGEVCKQFARDLPKTCANTAVTYLVPGGGLITASGVLEPITDAIQNFLFKDNPKWRVPLSVRAYALVSTSAGVVEERPVPCNAVRVAGKTLDANCGVTVSISKKQLIRDVTPSADAPYYRYEIMVNGSATKQAQAPRSSFFASIAQFFGLAQASVASAEDEEEVPVDQDGFLIVEGADREELPLVSEDTQTQLPLPTSDLNGIINESIFDTVSVDLKVNGQDGPIEVEKRDRIVLSWISDGATRCRGVWSKNDIKLSGTAAGRITRPVTIKIACINGDGERADDEVRVNVSS